MKRKYGFYASRAASLTSTSKRRKLSAKTRGLAPGASRGFFNRAPSYRRAPERKFIDTINNSDTIEGIGEVFLINGVAQGSDITNRIGRRYTNVSFQIRARVSLTGVTTPLPSVVRMMVVHDCQTNSPGSLPAVTDILQNNSGGNQVTSPNNLDNRDRFRVIMDKTVSLSPQGPQVHYIKKYKKINIETTNSGTTSAIGSIATGSLYLVLMSDQSATASYPVTQWYTRVRFTDE